MFEPRDYLVTAGELEYATHNAMHAQLSEKLTLSQRHLDESLGRLHRKATAILESARSWPTTAFGAHVPTNMQQHLLFDMEQEFFDLVYSTLSAFAAVLNQFPHLRNQVPWTGNDRFLSWLGGEEAPDYFDRRRSVVALKAARDFRTIYVHSAQYGPFDWLTDFTPLGPTIALVGPPKKVLPPGAEESLDGWIFRPPPVQHVMWSFARILSFYFGTMLTHFEWDDTKCTWEADGFGSAPHIAFEAKVAQLLAAHEAGGGRTELWMMTPACD